MGNSGAGKAVLLWWLEGVERWETVGNGGPHPQPHGVISGCCQTPFGRQLWCAESIGLASPGLGKAGS
eukprot:15476447-Alexandrium_andersonii.AAC.1